MNVVNYRVSLDMFDAVSRVTIKAKKGDSACKIHISLIKNGKIFNMGEGCYATFNAKKSDGNFIYDKCTIEGDTIVYDFASSIDENGVCQVSAIEGNVDCEVTLYNSKGEQLTSPRFTLYIDDIIYNGEEIISSPESDVLKGLIFEAGDLIEEMEDMIEQGGSGNGGNSESAIIEECLGIVTLKPNVYRYHLTLDAAPTILCDDVSLIPKGYSATVVFYNSANKETDKGYWTTPIQSNVLKDIADDGMALTDLVVGEGNDGVLITIYKADENAEKFNWYSSNVEGSGNDGIYVGEEEPTDDNVAIWVNPNGEATPTTEGVWSDVSYNRVDGYVKADWGENVSHPVAYYAEVNNIDRYKKVKVKGYQYGLNVSSVCYFLDASGTIIEAIKGNTEATEFETEVDVPETAKTLIVNGEIYTSEPVTIKGYREIGIQDIYNKLPPEGVKLMTFGDSITELGTTERGWIRYFIEKTNCELVANFAVVGAWLRDKEGTVYDGNPVFNGADDNVNNVLGNQIHKMLNGNYDTPDIIMVAVGSNDGIFITKEQIKAAYFDENNDLIPLENVDRTTSAGAYRWCFETLHNKYPNAIIFWCAPIMGFYKLRAPDFIVECAESLRIATEFTGQIMIDTIRCGITGLNEVEGASGEYFVDGLHPNVKGAKKIGYYNATKVIPFLDKGV